MAFSVGGQAAQVRVAHQRSDGQAATSWAARVQRGAVADHVGGKRQARAGWRIATP